MTESPGLNQPHDYIITRLYLKSPSNSIISTHPRCVISTPPQTHHLDPPTGVERTRIFRGTTATNYFAAEVLTFVSGCPTHGSVLAGCPTHGSLLAMGGPATNPYFVVVLTLASFTFAASK